MADRDRAVDGQSRASPYFASQKPTRGTVLTATDVATVSRQRNVCRWFVANKL